MTIETSGLVRPHDKLNTLHLHLQKHPMSTKLGNVLTYHDRLQTWNIMSAFGSANAIADANFDSLSILAPSRLTSTCRHLCRSAFFVLSSMLTQGKYSQSKFCNTFFYKQLNVFGHAFGCLG